MNIPKIEFKKILYTTDLSEIGRSAFPYAASIASTYGAELTVFHAVKPPEFENYLVGWISEEMWEQIKTQNLEDAKSLLINRQHDDVAIRDNVNNLYRKALAQSEENPYVVYKVVVKMGDPVQEIIKEAEAGGYDLVVMGKHGHGFIEDAVIGTTARRVMRRCSKPVMVVPLPE
ncbi:MAG: universal stress protein [Gammaproteobacteria bacterium]|nr:universal stress protein [Gammaproteobacteria bacterium]